MARIIGLSTAGKVAAGAAGIAAIGGGAYAVTKRKKIARAFKRARKKISQNSYAYRVGRALPGTGPLAYELQRRRKILNLQGRSNAKVRVPKKTVGKALGFGLAGAAAGEVLGPIASGVAHNFAPGAPGIIAGGLIAGHGIANGLATAAYARSERKRRAAARAQAVTGRGKAA
jgi:hypothetical protein